MNPLFSLFFLKAMIVVLMLAALVMMSKAFPASERVAVLLGGFGLIAMLRRRRA